MGGLPLKTSAISRARACSPDGIDTQGVRAIYFLYSDDPLAIS